MISCGQSFSKKWLMGISSNGVCRFERTYERLYGSFFTCVCYPVIFLEHRTNQQYSVSFSMQQERKYHLGEILLRCIVMLLVCLSVCQGMAILEGNSAEFNCTLKNVETSLWQVKKPDGTFQPIAQSGVVYSHYREKFHLEIQNESSGTNTSYFHILKMDEATVNDDGQYRCEEEGQIRTVTNLTVEIPPVLQLKRDSIAINSNIEVVSNKEVTIECVAEGGKPPVTLSWMVNGRKKTGPIIDNAPPSSDGRVISVILYLPTVEDNILSCVTSGQQVIPEQEVSVAVNVLYLPNCVMAIINATNAFVITCSCKANPEVQRYEIYVNGSLFSQEMKAILPSEKSATVYCNATNDVGSFATQPESVKPFHEEVPLQLSGSDLIIGLCVTGAVLVLLISVAILAFCMYRKKKKAAEETEETLNRNHATATMAMIAPPKEYDTPKQVDDTLLKESEKEETPD